MPSFAHSFAFVGTDGKQHPVEGRYESGCPYAVAPDVLLQQCGATKLRDVRVGSGMRWPLYQVRARLEGRSPLPIMCIGHPWPEFIPCVGRHTLETFMLIPDIRSKSMIQLDTAPIEFDANVVEG